MNKRTLTPGPSPASGRGEKHAWDLLGDVEAHPQVREWLEEAENMARESNSHPSRFAGPFPLLGARRWKTWAMAASVVLAVGVGFAGYLKFSATDYETGVGEMQDVKLADGSKVTLNTDTAIAVRYSDGRRYIELKRGEALFKVAPEAARPFEVEAAGTLTRALGTEFNVDMRRSKVTVSVLDGAVQVARPKTDRKAESMPVSALGKGQAVEIRLAKARTPSNGYASPSPANVREEVVKAANLKRIDAWQTRRLEFSDTPLSEAVEEFNRYSTTHLSVGSEELGATRVSGVFRTGDADGFLFSIQEALNVEAHPSGDEIVLIRKQP